MAKSKRKNERETPRRRSVEQAASGHALGGDKLLRNLLRGTIALLVVARWLVPTESAVEGDTLWLTQLILGTGLLWVWAEYRVGEPRLRFGFVDLSVLVLVLGHVVSAVYVLATEGEKRAAINMLWEWVALGVLFFLLRQTMSAREDARRLIGVLLTTTVVLAGLGIWQHFVFYPQAVRDYDQKRAELDRLMNEPAPPQHAAARQARIREIESEWYIQGVPLDGSSRQLYEQRLRSSTEPFGMFALANSFAALLTVGLFAALSSLKGAWTTRSLSRGKLLAIVACTLLIAYCLVLTKSRTAWVGLFAGLLTWGLFAGRSRVPETQFRAIQYTAAALLLLGLLFGAAALTGGIDAAVFSEASKSLRYRVQFWRGAVAVLRESPFFGTGPGNFRQHYLRHKLPESSEEIADPHNFLLDVWACGGLIAVVGLVGFLGATATVAVRNSRRFAVEPTETGSATRSATDKPRNSLELVASDGAILLGALAAIPLVLAADFLSGHGTDHRLVGLWLAWCLAAPLFFRVVDRARADVAAMPLTGVSLGDLTPGCLCGALVALVVHLSGAGGIEMPAIVQTLMLVSFAAMTLSDSSTEQPLVASRGGFLVAGSVIAISFAACLYTATLPVVARKSLVSSGDAAISQGGGENAERFYREAAATDPISPEPLEKMAELSLSRWQQASHAPEDLFEKGLQLSQLAIEANPHNPHGYWRLGEWYLRKYERTSDRKDAVSAVDEYTRAVERYPNNVRLRAERAQALAKSGRAEDAKIEARFAIKLHRINRLEGHNDQCLPTKAEIGGKGASAGSLGPTVEDTQALAGE